MLDDKVTAAYLERIGLSSPVAADGPGLRELHRAHLLTVPFENLSIHLGEPISLDQDDLIAKVVSQRRGGFCYELNGAFALLLEAMGAKVRRVSAKVYGGTGLGPPFDHLALIVTAADGSGPWLADVGFGNNSMCPLRLDDRGEQPDPGGTFRIADAEGGDIEGCDTEGCDIEVSKNGEPQYVIERR